MKKGLFILLTTLMIVGCKTAQKGVVTESSHERIDSIYIEKLVRVTLPPDSAQVRALLECDKNGKIVLRWLDLANSKNVQLNFKLDSLGHLLTKMKVPPNTIYIPSKEEKVSKANSVSKTKVIAVEKKMNGITKFFFYSGLFFWCLIIVYTLFKCRKKIIGL